MGDAEIIILNFLNEFVNELSSSKSEDFINAGIAGNYSIKPEDVSAEAVDVALHHLGLRKCPHQLRAFLARRVAVSLCASVAESENCPFPTAEVLHMAALDSLNKLCHYLIQNPQLVDMSAFNRVLPFTSSEYAIQNKRRKMEDRHVVIHDMSCFFDIENCPKTSYYAVFDGHAGIDTASFAAAHLHEYLAQHPDFTTDLPKAITEAYMLTDTHFCDRANKEGLKGGCTAVTAVVREGKLYVAWLGDSQVVLVKQGRPVVLMHPHLPDREDERERIEHLGGFVCHVGTWRVNGTLAVSRAIGDEEFKPYISSDPEINIVDFDGTEDFLLLACDGLWDCMTPEDASVALYQRLGDASKNPMDDVAKKLVDISRERGSDDNITAIVVFLRNLKDITCDALKFSYPIVECGEELPSYENIVNENVLVKGGHVPERPNNLHDIISTFPSLGDEEQRGLSAPARRPNLPPEATVLSELPTPPIDELILNEQFVQVHLSKELDLQSDNAVVAKVSPGENVCDAFNSSNTPVDSEEAIKIASNVVSSVIETAIFQVDSPVDNNVIVDSVPAIPVDSVNEDQVLYASNGIIMDGDMVSNVSSEIPCDLFQSLSVADCNPGAAEPQTLLDIGVNISSNCNNMEPAVDLLGNLSEIEACKDNILISNTNFHLLDQNTAPQICSFEGNIDCSTAAAINSVSAEIVPTEFEVLIENELVNLSAQETGKQTPETTVVEEVVNLIETAPSEVLLGNIIDPLTSNIFVDMEAADQNGKLVMQSDDNLKVNAVSDEIQPSANDIDLKSIPVGIPEAEGVVEDNDTDSEKDGGWSFIKPSVDAPAGQVETKSKKSTIKAKVPPTIKNQTSSTIKSTVKAQTLKNPSQPKTPTAATSGTTKPTVAKSSVLKTKAPIKLANTEGKQTIRAATSSIRSLTKDAPLLKAAGLSTNRAADPNKLSLNARSVANKPTSTSTIRPTVASKSGTGIQATAKTSINRAAPSRNTATTTKPPLLQAKVAAKPSTTPLPRTATVSKTESIKKTNASNVNSVTKTAAPVKTSTTTSSSATVPRVSKIQKTTPGVPSRSIKDDKNAANRLTQATATSAVAKKTVAATSSVRDIKSTSSQSKLIKSSVQSKVGSGTATRNALNTKAKSETLSNKIKIPNSLNKKSALNDNKLKKDKLQNEEKHEKEINANLSMEKTDTQSPVDNESGNAANNVIVDENDQNIKSEVVCEAIMPSDAANSL